MTNLSRRRALAFAATLALPGVVRARTDEFDADIAIVGAGAAGLAAARECMTLEQSFILLEARNRIGGRVHTDMSLGQPFDAGAVYIHWAEKNPWAQVASNLKVATAEDPGGRGAFQFFERGKKQERSARRRGAFDKLGDIFDIDADQVPDVSIADRAAAFGEDVSSAAGTMARMALGEEPERVSSKDYARLWSGDDLIIPSGYGNLVARYGADLPARTSVVVQAIDYSGSGVRLQTSHGTIRARRVILTVSVGVLASGAIKFTPALPDATQAGIAGLGMGNLGKIALRFNGERFGIPDGSDVFDQEAARTLFDFECWGFGHDLVVAYVGGDHAREVLGLGRAGAVAAALDVFASIVGSGARRAFIEGQIANWDADPFACGAYSHALPGQAGARAQLAIPIADRIWLAGEATAGTDFGGAMTAGGAFLAGRDAVRAIAKL